MSALLCCAASEVERLFEPGKQDKDDGIRRTPALSNAGLVWERYLDVWDRFSLLKDEGRRGVLQRFARDVSARSKTASPGKNHVKTLLRGEHARQARILERWPLANAKGITVEAKLASRLAIGLGAPHPTEIGFCFSRSIGVPYLPGSSVKGLCRAAGRLVEAASMEEMFGPEQIREDGKGKIGDLVFLDAYPSEWPSLQIDIINCHHPRYYNQGGKLPSEADSPVPVYFLTVASGTAWTFRVVSRSGEYHDHARKLLGVALSELGAGAKTAVGYGVFDLP